MHWLDPTQTKQHQAKKQPVAVVRAAIQASFITERFKLLD
jgi:23S rRNA maturation mini-RNase III